MVIRKEAPADYNEIYYLIKTAFATAKVKDGDEQDFAVMLRNSKNYIPNLALVVEDNGKLIGHIMLTRTFVDETNGGKFEALLLAPVCILLEYRGKGIGSMLIKESLLWAKQMGYKAVFLVGDPAYYQRFGFKQTSEYGIRHQSIPEQYVMVCELLPHALDGVKGIVTIC